MLVEEVPATSQHMFCCGYFVAMFCPFCHFLPVSIVFSIKICAVASKSDIQPIHKKQDTCETLPFFEQENVLTSADLLWQKNPSKIHTTSVLKVQIPIEKHAKYFEMPHFVNSRHWNFNIGCLHPARLSSFFRIMGRPCPRSAGTVVRGICFVSTVASCNGKILVCCHKKINQKLGLDQRCFHFIIRCQRCKRDRRQ